MKHTPGPWIWFNNFLCQSNDDGSIPINSKIIIEVVHEVEADRPDARLIAAAPEMYATLEMVLAILCDKEICGHFLPREIREEIEPVLAKIKGE